MTDLAQHARADWEREYSALYDLGIEWSDLTERAKALDGERQALGERIQTQQTVVDAAWQTYQSHQPIRYTLTERGTA